MQPLLDTIVGTHRISPFCRDGFCNFPPLLKGLRCSLATFWPRHHFPLFNTLHPLVLELFIQDLVGIPLQLFLTNKALSRSFCNQVLPLKAAIFLHHQPLTPPLPPNSHSNSNFHPCLFAVQSMKIENEEKSTKLL
jgi:hypothetical protein